MLTENLVEFFYNKNQSFRKYSDFYANSREYSKHIGNKETTSDDNNSIENNTMNSTGVNEPENNKKNFIVKRNYETKSFPSVIYNDSLSKEIDALEFYKKLENYLLPNLIKQQFNKENKKIINNVSKNYIPTSRYNDKKLRLKLYHKIKIGNRIYCIYCDQEFRLYKIYFDLKKVKNKKNNTSNNH